MLSKRLFANRKSRSERVVTHCATHSPRICSRTDTISEPCRNSSVIHPVRSQKVSKYCYVYVLRSLKDDQFYVGLTRDLPLRLQQHNKGLVTQPRSARHLSLYIGKAVSLKATQRNARNISRVRGANVTSKPDCDAISRGKRRPHHDDLHARAQPARAWGEKPTRLRLTSLSRMLA